MFFFCLYAFWVGYLWWWMPTILTVVISQTLIILDWKEASYGTIANLIIILAVTVGVGQWSLENTIKEKMKYLTNSSQLVLLEREQGEKRFEELPEMVKTWLSNSNALNQDSPEKLFLKQSGEMRTSPDGKWIPFKSRQWINPNEPAFIWKAEVNILPGFHLSGMDSYLSGKGNMNIRLMSVIPIANTSGSETDQGSLLRWLAEMVWYPHAALHQSISWEELDSTKARAKMSFGNMEVEGVFSFEKNGDLRSFIAKRYFEKDGEFTLEDWEITVNEDGYKSFNGVRIPADLKVKWNLSDGSFHWLNMQVDAVEWINR
ncbi:MAG: hypothetical protein EA362_12880 [Saprospirales bacterium]|nr:MAG: hypothetical protein EA362_12880 [Saprospirales bacterium]